MTSFRQAELYVQRRIVTALSLVRGEGDTSESVAERYLIKCLGTDYPGIFDVIDECETEFDLARNQNKARVDNWRKTLKQLNTSEPL